MENAKTHPYSAVLTELVVFTVSERTLRVLLAVRGDPPFNGAWSLPGRYLRDNQALDVCARRELEDNAALMDVYIEQLYSFGRPNRVPDVRTVSVAYFGVVPPHRRVSYATADRVRWFAMEDIPALTLDHEEIMNLAHRRLQDKLKYTTIAFQFTPQQFTFGELQAVYETILGEKLDKRNFRKRMHSLDCLEETGRLARDGSHRPARLYRPRAPGQVAIVG
jgi:8-oxo-dGTP diphosphatase